MTPTAADERILFDHIAIACRQIADAPAFLVGELGGKSSYGGPGREFNWWQWDYAGGGCIEVIEPDGTPGGFVERFLDRRGAGLHHVTFKVPDLDAVCRRAESHGYDIVGFHDSGRGWREAFLHPKQAMGIVVQFAEGRGDGSGPRHEPPPEPAQPPPPVRMVGLRMVASDRERALFQWRSILAGEVEEEAGELRFRWPDSPMRIAVTLDPGGSDRSQAIEVESDRPLELPADGVPGLGVEFSSSGR